MVVARASSEHRAVIAVERGNGQEFYSYSDNGRFGWIDLKKDDRVKVIFRGTRIVIAPSESEYMLSGVKDDRRNIENLDDGYRTEDAHPPHSKEDWKDASLIGSDDMIVLPRVWLLP